MINLLPPKQKQELLEEEKLRLTFILGILFLCFLVCLSLILFFIKNYTLWDLETEKILVREKEKTLSFNEDLEKEIKESNIFLANLTDFYQKHTSLTKVLETIDKILPSDVYLTSFDFVLPRTQTKEKPRISVNGFSPDRETLLSFQENLKSEQSFSDIYFSPVSWIESENINFNITFKFNKEVQ
jgi:Tfp pilus assembly protein PilN